MNTNLLVIGACAGFVGMVFGGLGYWLRTRLSASMLPIFETGVRYQMYSALAIVCVSLMPAGPSFALLTSAGWFFTCGIVLFCGSFFLIAFTKDMRFGAITPYGGTALMIAWLLLAVAGLKH